MAMTNAERQKRFREKRNDLARQTPGQDLHTLLTAAWRTGGLALLTHTGHGVCADISAAVSNEVAAKNLTFDDLRQMAWDAGEKWACDRFSAEANAYGSRRQAAPAQPVTTAKKRRERAVT